MIFSTTTIVLSTLSVLLLLQSAPLDALTIKNVKLLKPAANKAINLNSLTPPRSGHVTFRSDSGDDLYLFGGYVEEVEKGDGGEKVSRYVKNDLWRWDNEKLEWHIICDENGSDVPGPRLASAAAVVNGRPTLFGGWDPQEAGTGGIILDTVHQLDLSTMKWNFLKDVRIPDGPTSRHVALTLPCKSEKQKQSVLIHNHRCIDHVLLFEHAENSNKYRFRKQKTSGSPPSSRGLHVAALLQDQKHVVLFGGAAQDGNMSNEVFVLNIDSWIWQKIQVKNDDPTPTPRAGACLCTLSDDSVMLFGGAEKSNKGGLNARADLWELKLDLFAGTGSWSLVLGDNDDDSADCDLPPPRNAATLCEVDPPPALLEAQDKDDFTGRYFILQGGWAPFIKTWAETFFLRLEMGDD